MKKKKAAKDSEASEDEDDDQDDAEGTPQRNVKNPELKNSKKSAKDKEDDSEEDDDSSAKSSSKDARKTTGRKVMAKIKDLEGAGPKKESDQMPSGGSITSKSMAKSSSEGNVEQDEIPENENKKKISKVDRAPIKKAGIVRKKEAGKLKDSDEEIPTAKPAAPKAEEPSPEAAAPQSDLKRSVKYVKRNKKTKSEESDSSDDASGEDSAPVKKSKPKVYTISRPKKSSPKKASAASDDDDEATSKRSVRKVSKGRSIRKVEAPDDDASKDSSGRDDE